jgi:predicted dehydrogenase
MRKLTRRDFIKRSLAAAAGAGITAAIPTKAWSQVVGSNDAIRLAIIGLGGDKMRGDNNGNIEKVIGGKGGFMIPEFRNIPGVRIVALCDVDKYNLERERKQFDDANEKIDTYIDVRTLLERKDIDAVYIATPNHWHTLISVWACQAGKDVYVEKPVSYNIWEGRKMVEAARKYNRIVQSGTHRRSDDAIRKSIEYAQSGQLGKIKLARAICYRYRPSIGKVNGPQPIPATVDYNLWCGPAPKEPLMRKNLHYDWHWVWNTGNGEIGDLGSHHLDVARWAVGQKQFPKRVISLGERFGYVDDGQTPNTQIAFFDYEPAPILWEVRGLCTKKGSTIMDNFLGVRQNTVIHCEDGYVIAGAWAYDRNGKKIKQFVSENSETHPANFIKAVRSRNPDDLTAEILEGHLSAALSHIGNISHRLGQKATPEQIKESIKNRSDVIDAFDRMRNHLAANKINIKKNMAVLGPWLTMDPDSEKFTGTMSDKANEFLTRQYRKPFVLTEEI